MKFVSNLNFNNTSKIVNSSTPINPQDGAIKLYVDTETTLKAPTVQIFYSSGTWTRPSGCKKIKVTVVGGGGKGGGVRATSAVNTTLCASGGGGGGAAIAWIDVTGSVYDVGISITVGSGGASGNTSSGNGASGGASRFNTSGSGISITANGGGGGEGINAVDQINGFYVNNYIANVVNGIGGSGTISTGTGYVIPGGACTGGAINGTALTSFVSNSGGGSLLASKGQSVRPSNTNVYFGNSAGYLYGGGGNGTCVNQRGSADSSFNMGGNGANGIVIIEEYY